MFLIVSLSRPRASRAALLTVRGQYAFHSLPFGFPSGVLPVEKFPSTDELSLREEGRATINRAMNTFRRANRIVVSLKREKNKKIERERERERERAR